MKWFLNLPYFVRITIGLSVAAGMFILIWQLNKKRQALEPVWADGERTIEHNLAKLPLTVYFDEEFGPAHGESVLQAVKDMNAVGCTLMVPVPSLEGAAIHIRSEGCEKDAESKPNHPGCTWLNPATGQIIIQVGQPGDVTASYLIFFHELTHAWGLAHDGVYKVPERPDDAPLFIPITANNSFEHAYRLGQGKHLPGLSDKDRAALKGRYCGSQTN